MAGMLEAKNLEVASHLTLTLTLTHPLLPLPSAPLTSNHIAMTPSTAPNSVFYSLGGYIHSFVLPY